MIQNELILSEKRDFSDVINASFRFIKQEFKQLYGTVFLYTIIPLVGVSILAIYYTTDVWSGYFQGMIQNSPNVEMPNIWMYFLMMVISSISHVLIIGITYEYMAMYHRHGRGNFTTSDVVSALAKDFFPIIGYGIVVTIVLTFAFLFFVIPGIYMMVPLSMIIIVKLVERNGFSVNWGRCFKLIKDNWWITFAIILIASIITGVISAVFSMPTLIYGVVQGVVSAQGGTPEVNHVVLGIFSLISTLGTYMLYVVVYVIIGFQYFSLSATEGSKSIIDKINEIGSPEADNA